MSTQRITLRWDDGDHVVELLGSHRLSVDGEAFRVSAAGPMLRVEGARGGPAWVVSAGDKRWVYYDGCVYELEVQPEGRRRRTAHKGSLAAPMPATVRQIRASVGDVVARGDTLVVLEAMKMELPVRANVDGTVVAVHCQVDELVAPGRNLVEIAERTQR